MARVNKEEEIGTGPLEGQDFLYTLMQSRKSYANYFKLDFLTGLEKEWSNMLAYLQIEGRVFLFFIDGNINTMRV
jgi:hypothetical protein